MPQPLVLAIEPDPRQAAIVKRIVREKVMADVAVVDSREAALDAMRVTMPDVLLLSALMSPRDEDELFAHLRTLEHADHLQTHTIPQLASTLNPAESRGSRGLLSAFRRKKEPEPAAAGCDPDMFAEEIRMFLERAADKKRERAAATPDTRTATDTSWRKASTPKAVASEPDTAAPAPADGDGSSSWASPFEWKPSNPSSVSAPVESPAGEAASFVPDPGQVQESLMAHLRPPAGIPTVNTIAAEAAQEEFSYQPLTPVEPLIPIEPMAVVAEPYIAAEPAFVEPAFVEPAFVEPPFVEPAYVEPAVLAAVPEPAAPAPVAAAPARGRDARGDTKDSGLGIRDHRRAMRDKRLGALASWARAESRRRDTAQEGDDVRGLLTSLAVPTAIVAVGYGRGVRIRRVRVPAAREPHETEAVGAVILSKRVLAEQRGLRDQPTA